MRRALDLASRGAGQVSPSPLVGCVIVTPEGRSVGEGCFLYSEVNHAETLALRQAGEHAEGATAYISLEPHAHHGRTPPCTEALIKAGIKRVVAPIEDPNPLVSGKGFERLRAAGLDVIVGVLAREAALLNEKYIHFMKAKRPFVHLKLAVSLDGRVATRTGDSKWITGAESRARVHELRHEYDAILIGSRTAERDDPLLTDRSGLKRHRPITRIVLGNHLTLSPESNLVKSARDSPVVVFTSQNPDRSHVAELEAHGVEIVCLSHGVHELSGIMDELGKRSIQSVLVEGGAKVAGAFLDQRLINKVSFFIAPILVGGSEAPAAIGGSGVESIADAVNLENLSVVHHGRDVEITGYPIIGTKDAE